MFKRITFIFVFTLAALSAKAQFKIENDTLYAEGFANNFDLYAETHIYSLAIGPQLINWQRTLNQLPDPKWTSAVCDIVSCKSVTTDTGSFIFDPGDTGFLSFHFYPTNFNASGKMIVRFSLASDPLQAVDVVINARGWKPVGIDQIQHSVTKATPNPAQNTVTFNNDRIKQGKLEVYNAIGQMVLSLDYNNNMTVDIMDFAPGIYTVKIFDESHTSFSKIIKE